MRTVTHVLVAAGLAAGMSGIAHAQARADEVTISQDQLRDGWDHNEPGLSPSIVTGGTFGRLFRTAVNGQVYAQPLAITAPGGQQSVIVATENDYVYSLDAQTGAVNWSLSLGPAWPSSAVGCDDLAPSIGITSTPVYDPATGTVYVAAVVNDSPSQYAPHVYLEAIDAATGTADWKVPVQGAPVNDPSRPFDPLTERQRASLLLLDGEVYFGFASYCDYSPYVGYVAGVNTVSHALTLWTSEAGLTDNQAGIWQSGSGLMADGPGRIFAATGNGVSPAPGAGTSPPGQLGDSVVRLGVQADGSLAAQDFFSPANAPTLDMRDTDYGSGGPVGLPFGTSVYPHLLAQAGKDGRVFLLSRDSLGGRAQGPGSTDNPVYVTPVPFSGQWGHPAAFAGSGGEDFLYYSGARDFLRALRFDGTTNPARPTLTDAGNSPATFGSSSGSPVVTSNGADPASAVVWEVYEANAAGANGTLEAFRAVPTGGQLPLLWSAPIGTASKFSVPATDSGRVYVGTRDGHVLGFGSPDSAPLSGTQVAFGQVNAGQTAQQTMTVTARATVTVTGITTTSASSPDPFSAGQPSRPLPATLSPGDTITVPVTFTPSGPGGATGALAFATDTPNFGTVTVPLSGDGVKPGFYASPGSLQFGTVPTGGSGARQVIIANGGTAPELVSAIGPPGAPFTATGLPADGTTIPPGGSVTVTVTYKPVNVGSDSGTLTVTSPDGTATVTLNGTAIAGRGTLTVTSGSADFGPVSLGQQASQTLNISNTGNLPMTITGYRAPAVPFGTPTPVSTGLSLNPGDDLRLPVLFTPQSTGTVTGAYQLTATDSSNPPQSLTIGVSGTGAAPASGIAVPAPGGGWNLNGSARISGRTVLLTQATRGQAGDAVFDQPLASDGLKATFTASIGSGSGADGMTFALLDAAKAVPTSLGGTAASLGFGGMPGVAVTLDTYRNPGYPSSNFLGIATGTSRGLLKFAATTTQVPNLRKGSHVIGVAVSGGTITVSVDGTRRLSAAVPVPPDVLAAFTAGTGGLTDVHAVSRVSLSSAGIVPPPPGGGWSYNGSALQSGSATALTQAVASQSGTVVYPVPVATSGLQARFTMKIGGGTGADGATFALLSPSTAATALGRDGHGLGFAGLSGVAVAFATYQAPGYPSANFAGISTGAHSDGTLAFSQTVQQIGQLRSGTHSVEVTSAGGVLTVYFDGVQILQQRLNLPATALLAFTGGTGGRTDVHWVNNVAIAVGGPTGLAGPGTTGPAVPAPAPAPTVPAPSPTVPAPSPTVELNTTAYGPVLATPAGMTLYRQVATCPCDAQYHPLLALPGQPLALPPLLHGKLGTVPLADGGAQVTFDGWPLFGYGGDHAEGDAFGVNPSWQVIRPAP